MPRRALRRWPVAAAALLVPACSELIGLDYTLVPDAETPDGTISSGDSQPANGDERDDRTQGDAQGGPDAGADALGDDGPNGDGAIDARCGASEGGAVLCGTDTCAATKPVCCVAMNGPSCTIAASACNSFPRAILECDDLADCAGAKKLCCAQIQTGVLHTFCADTCAAPGAPVCGSGCDCEGGLTCQPSCDAGGLPYGACGACATK
jgi:hypothetical protein